MISFKEYYNESVNPLKQRMGHIGFKDKVTVYFNINLSKKLKSDAIKQGLPIPEPMFSIEGMIYNDSKGKKTKKVIGHDTRLMMRDVQFTVIEKNRLRVIATGSKNVHAKVHGYLIQDEQPRPLSVDVTYNPYKYNSFVRKQYESPIYSAKMVSFINGRMTVEE